MSWNYRILRKPQDTTIPGEKLYFYIIVEAYYDKNDKINGWCEGKDNLEWDDLEDLEGTIKQLQNIIGKPILEEKDNTLIEVTTKLEEINKNGKID